MPNSAASQTTGQEAPHDIIRAAVQSVCSDGNADSGAVARAVIGALYGAGWQIVPAIEVPDAD